MRSVTDRTPLVSEIVLTLLLISLLCAPMLDAMYGGIFSYVDEMAVIILIIWALFAKQRHKVGTREKIALGALGGLCFLGLAGNLLFGYQGSPFAVAVDLFTCVKLFAAFLAARVVLQGRPGCLAAFLLVGKAFLVAASFGLLLHVIGVVQLGSGRIMFGIPCYQFLFSHPTNLAAYCVGFAAIMFTDEKPQTGWIVLTCILLVSTQRAKAAAMAFIILFFLVYGIVKHDDRKPSKSVFVFLAIGAVIIGADQIQSYFLTPTAARSLLAQCGLGIAFQSFPLGSGFATFATYMSGVYYSPLYYEYGLNIIWGLSPAYPAFIADTFWPAVVAQFGLVGLAAFVVLLGSIFGSISSDCRKRGIRFAAYGTIPLYLIILSTSDASFFNFYSPFYALILGAIVSKGEFKIRKVQS